MNERRDEMTRITDDKIRNVIQKVENNEEGSIGEALKALLEVTLDTRAFLRKVYKSVARKRRPTNVVNDPLKAKKGDIVTGNDQDS